MKREGASARICELKKEEKELTKLNDGSFRKVGIYAYARNATLETTHVKKRKKEGSEWDAPSLDERK